MQQQSPAAPAVRPPVFLGCTAALLAVFAVVVAAVFFVGFLQSGADTGKRTLNAAVAYAPGTIQYVSQQNLYVARTPDGQLLALSDLDAANRAAQVRCRVGEIAPNDPTLPQLLKEYGARMSPQALDSTVLLQESCHNAIYDYTGLRLDSNGPNLERYAVSIDAQGKLVVDVSKRTCTQREGQNDFAVIPCPK